MYCSTLEHQAVTVPQLEWSAANDARGNDWNESQFTINSTLNCTENGKNSHWISALKRGFAILHTLRIYCRRMRQQLRHSHLMWIVELWSSVEGWELKSRERPNELIQNAPNNDKLRNWAATVGDCRSEKNKIHSDASSSNMVIWPVVSSAQVIVVYLISSTAKWFQLPISI